MMIRNVGNSGFNLLPGLFAHKGNRTAREREVRFLLLGIFLSLLFCVAFASALLLLNKQGRI